MKTSKRLAPTPVLCLAALSLAWLASGLAAASAQETADRRFEKLLTAAKKDPGKADWKTLRRAFSMTTRYDPYSVDVDEKLKEIAQAIGRGEFKESEAALLKLVERDGFMRFDSLAMLMRLYDKTEQPEKAKIYKGFLEGILGVLDYPKSGVSFENPIEVLFVQEEYLVTTNMPKESQGLVFKNGRRYDVLTIKAEGDRPERQVFFNIDLLRNAGPNQSAKN